MTRLDRHVHLVRTKLFIGTLLSCLAWTLAGFAAIFLLAVLVDRFLIWRPPAWEIWASVGLGLAVVGGVAWAIYRRPTSHQAAIAIDERLGLKEKFSTAIYVRPSTDPFAAAAVRDAERTADNVSLHKRFPVAWPRHGLVTASLALVALVLAFFVGQHPLFAKDPQQKAEEAAKQAALQRDAKSLMEGAIREIDSAPPEIAATPKIQAARADLLAQLAQSSKPAQEQAQTALKTMKELDELKQKVAGDERMKDDGRTSNAEPGDNKALGDNSALKDVPDELAKGQFNKAADNIEKVVNNFNNLKKEDQKKAADDVDKIAKQLQQQADKNQKQVEDLKKQLQQMGANQQQLNQLQQQLQAAANGDKQAQQQAMNTAQQIANQVAQNGTPQQKQQLQQTANNLAQQMQQAANQQVGAQNMSSAAQQLANTMKQQAAGQQQAGAPQQGAPQQGAGQQQAKAGGQQGKNGQQPGGQQPGGQQANAGQQPGGQQPGGQNPAGQQPGGQQPGGQQANAGQQPGGQQPGGQQPGGNQGQGQNLADQLAQLQQAAQDAQLGQNGGGDGAAPDNLNNGGDPNAGQNGNGQNPNGEGQMAQGGGQWQPQPNQAAGGRGQKQTGLAGFKPEKSPSQTNGAGELIVSQFIKAPNVVGKSTAELQELIKSKANDAPDTVDQDHVSKQEEAIIKKYYDSISGK